MAGENYKLTYFHGRGRAEICRLAFVAAGVPYEDHRISMTDDWPTVKPTMIFQQLPVLKSKDIELCQTATIARFIARTHGLMGNTPLEQARVEMISDCIVDMQTQVIEIVYTKDAAVKKEKLQTYAKDTLPVKLGLIQKMLEKNGSSDSHFVGKKLSLADLYLMDVLDWSKSMGLDVDTNKFPKLNALVEKIRSIPAIAKWLSSRPKTDF